MKRIREHVENGMKHDGFFELVISGVVAAGGKRKVNIKYAPSEQYTVPEEELYDN